METPKETPQNTVGQLEEWKTTNRHEHNASQATVGWLEEIQDQDFEGDAFGACTTNTFSLSDRYGNQGDWCTITVECMGACS